MVVDGTGVVVVSRSGPVTHWAPGRGGSRSCGSANRWPTGGTLAISSTDRFSTASRTSPSESAVAPVDGNQHVGHRHHMGEQAGTLSVAGIAGRRTSTPRTRTLVAETSSLWSSTRREADLQPWRNSWSEWLVDAEREFGPSGSGAVGRLLRRFVADDLGRRMAGPVTAGRSNPFTSASNAQPAATTRSWALRTRTVNPVDVGVWGPRTARQPSPL